jgi:hypothetical protein
MTLVGCSLPVRQVPSELVIIVVGPRVSIDPAISGRPSSQFSPSPMPQELFRESRSASNVGKKKEEETPCYLTVRDLFSLFTKLLKSTTKTRIQQSIPVDII